MLSIQYLVCLLLRLSPSTVPWGTSLGFELWCMMCPNHVRFLLFTVVRSYVGPPSDVTIHVSGFAQICLSVSTRDSTHQSETLLSQRTGLFWWILQSWSNFHAHTAEWTSRETWTVFMVVGWLISLLFQILLTFDIADVATASLVLIVERWSLVRRQKDTWKRFQIHCVIGTQRELKEIRRISDFCPWIVR
jgi:hypothetical protein